MYRPVVIITFSVHGCDTASSLSKLDHQNLSYALILSRRFSFHLLFFYVTNSFCFISVGQLGSTWLTSPLLWYLHLVSRSLKLPGITVRSGTYVLSYPTDDCWIYYLQKLLRFWHAVGTGRVHQGLKTCHSPNWIFLLLWPRGVLGGSNFLDP